MKSILSSVFPKTISVHKKSRKAISTSLIILVTSNEIKYLTENEFQLHDNYQLIRKGYYCEI